MLVTKAKTTLLPFICALTCYSCATTVTVIVTPNGIVMASDSGRSTNTGALSPIRKDTTQKFSVVQNRLVVASVGMSDIGGVNVPYSFLSWMRNIEERLPANVSVDDLASTIERESAATFNGFDDVLSRGSLQKRKPLENCRTFIQYIIAGYGGGTAKIYVVQFYIDWERKKLVGPKRIPLFPINEATGNYVFYSFGITEALDDVSNPNSYAYKAISANCAAYRTLTARRDITITQSIAVAKEFVRVEEKTNPTEVFGPVVALALLPDGSILSPDTSQGKALPETTTGKRSKE